MQLTDDLDRDTIMKKLIFPVSQGLSSHLHKIKVFLNKTTNYINTYVVYWTLLNSDL